MTYWRSRAALRTIEAVAVDVVVNSIFYTGWIINDFYLPTQLRWWLHHRLNIYNKYFIFFIFIFLFRPRSSLLLWQYREVFRRWLGASVLCFQLWFKCVSCDVWWWVCGSKFIFLLHLDTLKVDSKNKLIYNFFY